MVLWSWEGVWPQQHVKEWAPYWWNTTVKEASCSMRSLWLPDEGLMPKRVGVTKCGDTDFTTTTSAKSIQNPNLCFNHCNAGWVFMELPLTSSASISFIRAVRSFPCTFSCSVCNFSSHWVISSSTYSLESGDTSAAVSSLWREMEEFWEKGKLKPGT